MFEMPDTTEKELAVSTQKVYKSKLNALSSRGFDNIQKIKEDPKGVIEAIEEITGDGDDDKTRHLRRTMLSAILWVTGNVPKSHALYKYYQDNLPSVNSATGEKWVKRKDFKE